MSFPSKIDRIYANEIQLVSQTGTDVNITCSTGQVKINGSVPGGGGGGSILPPDVNGTGNLSTLGNITATGDGITTGKMEAQAIKSIGNMVCDGDLSVPTGNINLTAGSLQIPVGSTNGINIAGSGDLSINSGDILMASGNLTQSGAGKINTGTGGLDSYGDIQTIGAHDLVIGNNIYFDGTDVFHRTENGGVITNTSYKDFKQLAGKNDNNIYTGTNDFADAVRLGTESGGTFTPSGLTLNTSGTLQSVNINNSTLLQCGNINCGNGGTNQIRCTEIITRTSENSSTDGWKIRQEAPSNPAGFFDKVLDFQGQEADAYMVVRSNDNTIFPNIVLNPRTDALGGLVVTQSLSLGEGGATDYILEQPKSGADTNNLLIKAGTGTNAKIKFQSNSGADLMFIEEATPGQGDGRIYLADGIYFGVTGIHNSITESGNDLLIDQNNASSSTRFRDNSNNPIFTIKKTEVVLSNNIPLNYGLYSTLPIQYKLTRTLTIAATPDTTNFTNMAFNCQSDTWTRVNDNTSVSMYNLALEGYYKCTITQTADSSSGNFIACDLIFDYILHLSIQTAPDIDVTEPGFNYKKKPTNQARPTIEIDHLNTPVQSQPVFVLYPNQSAGETMSIEVRLTKLDY